MDFWHLTHSEWFDLLDEDHKRRLNDAATELHFDKHQDIFTPETSPDHAFLQLSGLASIYRLTEDGDQLTLGFVQSGQVFGELSVVAGCPRETYSSALEETTVLHIPKSVFMEVLTSSQPASLYITKTIAADSFKLQRRLENLVFKSVRARLANVLLELAEDFGQLRDTEVHLDVHLTQTEYAQLVGASRPSVNIALKEFVTDGEIEINRHRLIIKDVPMLTEIAMHDLPRRTRR